MFDPVKRRELAAYEREVRDDVKALATDAGLPDANGRVLARLVASLLVDLRRSADALERIADKPGYGQD